jgi:hypothetical protein
LIRDVRPRYAAGVKDFADASRAGIHVVCMAASVPVRAPRITRYPSVECGGPELIGTTSQPTRFDQLALRACAMIPVSEMTLQIRPHQMLRPNRNQQMRLIHGVPERGGLLGLDALRCYFCNEVVGCAVAPGSNG